MKNDLDREYVEVLVPDTIKLAMYVNQAKGPNRTMAEFAKECGMVSPSTFSRIVNRKITKPLSVEFIQAIVRNAVDPDAIDYQGFMRANGMIPKDEQDIMLHLDEDNKKENDDRKKLEWDIRNIIANELYSRGIMLMFFPRLPYEEVSKSSFYLRQQSTFAIRMQGFEPLYWNFIVKYFESDIKEKLSSDNGQEYYMKWMMEESTRLFLKDAWEPETLNNEKNTFVFTEEKLFDAFTSMITKKKVNSDMSAVLVDLDSKSVVNEKVFPRNKRKDMFSVFDLEIKMMDDYDE